MANKRNPLHTRFCEMFDIEYPIAAFTHSADTVYEVCNAGGLGILGMGMGLAGTGSARGKTLAQHLEESIKLITSKTSKPYGVDMLLPGSLPADIGKMTASDAKKSIPDEQKRFVQRLKEEAGIPDLKGTDPGDSIFDTMSGKAINDVLEVMFEYKVPVFAAALGTPPEMVEKMHNHGMKVISLIGRVKHASRVIAAGTDIIVAQGYDAGGHTGEIGTLSLVPQVVDAVRAQAPDMPVLAAGGIMDGRGLAAALALGADGIWTGTIWQLALEHDLKMPLKQKILSAS